MLFIQGGGSGGSIRDAGGAFGKREAAREEEYFRKKQKEQLEQLKSHFDDEIVRHEQLIKEHQKAIEANKKKIKELMHDKHLEQYAQIFKNRFF